MHIRGNVESEHLSHLLLSEANRGATARALGFDRLGSRLWLCHLLMCDLEELSGLCEPLSPYVENGPNRS